MMMNRNPNPNQFFQGLLSQLSLLLNGILQEEASLFRRSPKVLSTAPFANSTDFHLSLVGREDIESEKGSFNATVNDNTVVVFRSPVMMKFSFLLYASGLSLETRLRAHDLLTSFFFDHKSIEPIIPLTFKKYPPLYDRLASTKAEIEIRPSFGQPDFVLPEYGLESFCYGFNYTALYHSGNPLREEQKVRSRVIDYSKTNERSAL